MWFGSALTSLSVCITFVVQVAFGYLTALCICAFIQSARTRVRVWGGFLLWTIATWVFAWIPVPAANPASPAFRSLPPMAAMHLGVPVTEPWASYFAGVGPIAAYLYLFLLLGLVLQLLLRSAQLKSALQWTQPPSPELQLCFRRLCLALGIRRCELRMAAKLRSPATCYWWRSHVLMPTELVPHLGNDQLEDVLRHELFHVRQHDYLWDRLAALGCRLVFFHPLVWMGYRHLRRERELACDYAVVQEGTEARLRYAECLTQLARWFSASGEVSPGISFFSSESLLAVRVRALLSEPPIFSPPRQAARAGFVAMIASIAIALTPYLGLSLYSTVHLGHLLTPPANAHYDVPRRKTREAKLAHSVTPRAPTVETMKLAPQSAERSLSLLMEVRPAPLPVLTSSKAGEDTAATGSMQDQDKGDRGLQGQHPLWDEAPMPLARPPKWRTLAIGAITGAVGMATGQVDVDDVDGPRPRSR